MDLKQIKQIIELMKRSELTEFAVEEEGFKLKIRRGLSGLPIVSAGRGSNPPFPSYDSAPPLSMGGPAQASPAATVPVDAEDASIGYIKSPMVGTFYRAASPESKPFAEEGTKAVENTVVCIIEAMKIMNEIQAEVKGTVVEALVENGQPVEYGQRLFKIRKA
ncbi:MAG: acetyl-CoA carboxylase biotin carboxyl carrier protein [Verrucomicrobiota bacterium]